MAIRTCPLCMTRVPGGTVVAYSNDMECPGCKVRLAVSPGSRVAASIMGLVAGALVWRLTWPSEGMLGWALPVVYAFLAFSVIATLFLMITADLIARLAEPVQEPVSAAPGHGHPGPHH